MALLMAVVAWLLSMRTQEQGKAWGWLMLFGLAGGVSMWLELFIEGLSWGPQLRSLFPPAVALSLCGLFEFGRRGWLRAGRPLPGSWLVLALLGLAGLAGLGGYDSFNAGIRLSLGVSGGLLSMLVLWREPSPERAGVLGLRVTAVNVGLFAVATAVLAFPVVLGQGGGAVALAPVPDDVLNFWIHVARALASCLCVSGFYAHLRSMQSKEERVSRWEVAAFPVVVGGVLAGALATVNWRGDLLRQEEQALLRYQAVSIARTISPERGRKIEFTSRDEGGEEYRRLCRQFEDYRAFANLGRVEALGVRDRMVFQGPTAVKGGQKLAPGTLRLDKQWLAEAQDTRGDWLEEPVPAAREVVLSAYGALIDPRTGDPVFVVSVSSDLESVEPRLRELRAYVIGGAMVSTLVLSGVFIFLIYCRRLRRGSTLWWLVYHEMIGTVVLGCFMTLLLYWLLKVSEHPRLKEELRELSNGRVDAMSESMRDKRDLLAALTRFIENCEEVTQVEFNGFAGPMAYTAGMQSWGWIPVVRSEDRPVFEQRLARQGLGTMGIMEMDTDGRMVKAVARDVHFPIGLLTPMQGNEGVLGFDFASDSLRRESVERCLRSLLPTGSEQLRMFHMPEANPVLVVLQPVFASDRSTVRGFAMGTMDLQRELNRVMATSSSSRTMVEVSLWDLSARGGAVPVAMYPRDVLGDLQNRGRPSERDGLWESIPIFVFGRTWALVTEPSRSFHVTRVSWGGRMVLVMGGSLTAILGVLAWLMTGQRQHLEAEVQQRTSALLVSENRYRGFFLHNRAVMMILDPETGAIVEANPAAEAFYGWSLAELRTRHIHEINTQSEMHVRMMIQAIMNRSQKFFVFQHRLADGSLRDVEVYSTPVEQAGRQLIFSIIHDITVRRRVEKELERQGRRYRMLMKTSRDALHIVGMDGRLLEWNDAFLGHLGCTAEEAQGLHVWDWNAEMSKETLISMIESLVQSGDLFETVHRCKDGSLRNVEISASGIEVDGRRLLYASARDITERKRTAEALRSSEERFQKIFERNPALLTVSRLPERVIVEANSAFLKTMGYTRDEVIGRTMEELGMFVNIGLVNQMAERIRRDGHVENFELVTRAKDGRLITGLVSAETFESGGVRSLVTVSVDVTELKRMERDLREAKRMAEASNQAKSEFLANMSHEIRTPMNGVIGMTGLLLDTQLDDLQRRYAHIVKSSGEALLSLINDILDFSKIEAGKLELEELDFDLRELLRDFTGMMEMKAREKGLGLRCEVAPEVPEFLRGDPSRLRQILTNLVGNAIKFTDKGGVRVLVSEARREGRAHVVRIQVIDTGIGIPRSKQDLLFKSFSQVDASTTRKFGGTGLGLAISKQLANLMGGEIGVLSEMGQGSEFWFTVKLDASYQPRMKAGVSVATQVDAKRGPAEPHPQLILVAEDNTINQQVVIGMLAKLGYTRVDVAGNGQEAYEALCRIDYDLVFMDVQMPELDGLETSRMVRKAGSRVLNARIPIIAMTAHAMEGDRERCLEAGMNDYISKPIEPEAVREILGRWLG